MAWGGIVDIYAPLVIKNQDTKSMAQDQGPSSEAEAVRIEFFGDTIESIRLFIPETQRTFREVKEYSVIPRSIFGNKSKGPLFIDSFRKKKPTLVMVFPDRCREHMSRFGEKKGISQWDSVMNDDNYQKALILDPAESDCLVQ